MLHVLMTDFKKRGGGGSYGARSGKPSLGGGSDRKPFGKPSFGNKSWGNDRVRSGGPITLHKATCAECSKVCEVPFRPMSGKPVYCKDCFNPAGSSFKNDRGGDRGGDRFPKKDFKPRNEYAPRSEVSTGSNDAVLKQLEALNTKIENLTRAIEAMVTGKAPEAETSMVEKSSKTIKKTTKKKVAKK